MGVPIKLGFIEIKKEKLWKLEECSLKKEPPKQGAIPFSWKLGLKVKVIDKRPKTPRDYNDRNQESLFL